MTHAIEGVNADIRGSAPHSPTDGAHLARGDGMSTARIIALPELHTGTGDASRAAAEPPLVRDWSPLHQIKARLQVCVGEATLSVGELLAAKEHQVLRLDRALDAPVDLSIDGKVIARGQLVAVDGHFAVRITELPDARSPFAGA